MSLPRITVLALGGTIATVPTASGMQPGLSAEDLIAAVPELAALATIQAATFDKTSSFNLEFAGVLALAEHIRTLAEQQTIDGVVITQGTDTIEETAFLLDLVLDLSIPVVVIGAMRNPSVPSHDGPGNLLAAVRAVTDPVLRSRAREYGVLVVMLDCIHSAMDVLKSNTHRIDAFSSPHGGPVGVLVEDRVILTAQTLRPYKAALREVLAGHTPQTLATQPGAVALLTISMDETGALLQALVDAPDHLGYQGIVLGAMGGGHVPAGLMAIVEPLAAKLPVVLAPRAGSGPLLHKTYGAPGAEIDLAQRDVLRAGRLHPLKARVLLSVLLRAGATRPAMTTVLDACE